MNAITDHPDFVALMRTVIAHPDADLPRLVLADWLEADAPTPAPAFAEFIRLQCEISVTNPYDGIACKVCGNTPDEDGRIGHGRGCYTQSEDGGGDSYVEPTTEWIGLKDRERELFDRLPVYAAGLSPTPLLTPPRQIASAPAVVVRRGFPNELHAPAAWVWGVECQRCHGRKWVEKGGAPLFTTVWCPACKGEGRTPAHGYEVIRKWPVTKVVVTGVTPDEEPQGDGSARWLWWRGRPTDGPTMAGHIPSPVYDRIAFARYGGSLRRTGIERPHADYPTEALALDALSAAIVATSRDTTTQDADE